MPERPSEPLMKPKPHFGRLFALILATVSFPASADEAPTLGAALAEGTTQVKLLYRLESVAEDAFAKDALASTLRTTLSYRTGTYKGFSLFLEAENVSEIGAERRFNNRGAGGLGNGINDRPVIADPEITEVNQAYLRFEKGETRLDLGRQELKIGDQRFVGPVGWRQNHQSFDALTVVNGSLDAVTLSYSFVDNVNRIFGDNQAMASHLLGAEVKTSFAKIHPYLYLLDYERPADAPLSTSTRGIEVSGERKVGASKLLFELELAEQSDYADNPGEIDAAYLHALLGLGFGDRAAGLTVRLGYEVLEGSPGRGSFRTPLATLHKFNGWADKFLGTPPAGVEDLYLHLSGKLPINSGKVSWLAIFHDFRAESSALDYGSEIDLQATWRAPWKQLFGAKAALYDADTLSTDTTKIWIWTAYEF